MDRERDVILIPDEIEGEESRGGANNVQQIPGKRVKTDEPSSDTGAGV